MNSVIYKITSPSGRIYIGQAVNFKARLIDYKSLKCKRQVLLYRSLLKYGFTRHLFEILERCEKDKLNEREMFYIAKFKTNYNKHRGIGLNLTDGGQGSTGYVHSVEALSKMSKFQSGKKNSEISNIKRSIALKGRPAPVNLLLKLKGSKQSEEHKKKRLQVHLVPVIDTATGLQYPSVKDAAMELGYNKATLAGWLRGDYKNNSTLKYMNV